MERQKWGSQRVRVTRACDRCKRRKIRCTGRYPCEICLRINLQCTFNAAYTRGRHPPPPQPVVPSRELDPLSRKATSFSSRDSNRVLDLATSSPDIDAVDLTPGITVAAEPPSRSPEPTQTDLQGHYVGPASGVSFLLGVQKRLHQSGIFSNASSIFTFGDTPLPYIDPTYCIIPAKDETTQLLQRYFDFTVPVDRFLHQPTVEELLREFYETSGAMKCKDEAPSSKALLFMVFALSQEHISPKLNDVTTNLSARYFLAADHLLSKERGAIRLISIQARLCQCLWLLSQSRINHCWSLFGTTARLALAIGLHLSRDANRADGLNYIDIECRRRTFWCAYSLDNYLSTALGRPRIFHDEDIDQELPSCLDDSEIYATHATPNASRSQSVMLAPVAYFKLGRILSMILRDMYSIRPPSSADRYALATKYSTSLKTWREQISAFLDTESANAALLIPIYRRQRNVLNLAYWHTMMLTHRPFLLRKFKELQSDGESNNNQNKGQTDENVWECLTAAMNIVSIVDGLAQAEQMFQAFWFTSYFAFSAIVVLYVYTIQQSTSSVDTYENYFTAATRCQNHLSNVAKEGSLAARYCLILADLRNQVLKQTEGLQREPHSLSEDLLNNSAATGADLFSGLNDQIQIPHQVSGTGDFEVVASGQFNPMIAAAFGGLEPFLYNDMLWS